MSNVVMLDETRLSGMMLRQAMSWSSKVHVDEVAAILFEAAYRVLVAAYGSRQIDEHLDRTSKSRRQGCQTRMVADPITE